jgi:predicted enzyme related to lactoylglutathione lyase
MNQSTPAVDTLNFIMVHVPDLAAVRSFYVDTLGLRLVDETPDFLMFTPETGGASLGIGVGEASLESSPVELWWQVKDADALYAALLERGVRVLTPPKDEPFGRSLTFSDPAGNVLSAYQPPASH